MEIFRLFETEADCSTYVYPGINDEGLVEVPLMSHVVLASDIDELHKYARNMFAQLLIQGRELCVFDSTMRYINKSGHSLLDNANVIESVNRNMCTFTEWLNSRVNRVKRKDPVIVILGLSDCVRGLSQDDWLHISESIRSLIQDDYDVALLDNKANRIGYYLRYTHYTIYLNTHESRFFGKMPSSKERDFYVKGRCLPPTKFKPVFYNNDKMLEVVRGELRPMGFELTEDQINIVRMLVLMNYQN